MSDFMTNYEKELEQEIFQFLFLADESDAKILEGRYRRKNLNEFVRVACIALIYGYRKIFLKIFAAAEKDADEFFKVLDGLNGKFDLIDGWVNGFIERVKDKDAQNLTREYWEEKKSNIDKNNFDISKLI